MKKNLKLKELKNIIHADLHLIDLDTNQHYKYVACMGSIFEQFEEYKVVGIRARAFEGTSFTDPAYIEIAITNK